MFEEVSVRLALWWRSRANAVTGHLGRRSFARPPFTPRVGIIRAAAVQMRPRLLNRATDFADHVYDLTRVAVQEGAELVVFPDHLTLSLLTLVPGLSATLSRHASLEEALAAVGEATEEGAGDSQVGIADVVEVATPALRRVYAATFATLARRFGVHIAAGGTMLAERDGRVLLVSYLYGPTGRVLIEQPKTHLSVLERRWGLGVGEDLRVVDTAVGRVALTGSMESMHFEPYRLLEAAAADVALLSTADVGRPQPWRPMRGLWARAQESRIYGVQGALVGDAFGLSFAGPAGIYAPLDLTPGRDGILALAAREDDDEVVVADLDIGALRRLREEEARARNREVIAHYLPLLYTRPWPWSEETAGQPAGQPHHHLEAPPDAGGDEGPAPEDV